VTPVTAADLQASFRGEIYGDALTMTEAWFADHVRRNDVDLARSPRWTVGGELSGAALLGFRGDRAWVGGFGVVPAYRGRGLARRYLAETLAIAREAGAASLELEVIAHNARAIALYEQGGFERIGELVAWSREPVRPRETAAVAGGRSVVTSAARLHTAAEVAALARDPATCWQREPRAVAAASPSELVLVGPPQAPRAYAFVRANDDGRASVLDAGIMPQSSADDATALIAELDRRFAPALMLVNEPPDGPLHAALGASLHWREFIRQFRMRAVL